MENEKLILEDDESGHTIEFLKQDGKLVIQANDRVECEVYNLTKKQLKQLKKFLEEDNGKWQHLHN